MNCGAVERNAVSETLLPERKESVKGWTLSKYKALSWRAQQPSNKRALHLNTSTTLTVCGGAAGEVSPHRMLYLLFHQISGIKRLSKIKLTLLDPVTLMAALWGAAAM